MQIKPFKLFFIFVFSLCLPSENTTAKTEIRKFYGDARQIDGDFQYSEEHIEIYSDGQIKAKETLYRINDIQVATLNSEFQRGRQHPQYEFFDQRFGYKEGVQYEGKQARLYFQEDKKPKKEKSFPLTDKLVVGQGFHYFLQDHLEEIAKGEVMHVKLSFPGKLDQYSFRMIKKELSAEQNRIRIRMEFDNWFLRLFTPYLDVDYDLKTKRLLRYQGLSNLKNSEGKPTNVEINYQYSQSGSGE